MKAAGELWMKAATPAMTRSVCQRGPVASPIASVTPCLGPAESLFVRIYILSGPGASVSRIAAPRKDK